METQDTNMSVDQVLQQRTANLLTTLASEPPHYALVIGVSPSKENPDEDNITIASSIPSKIPDYEKIITGLLEEVLKHLLSK